MWACAHGQKNVVQLLLDHSEIIDLNAKDNHGLTTLMIACLNGDKDIVQLLLEHSERIELNARAINGWTALMLACDSGHKDIVKLLLEYSDIDISGYHDLHHEMIDFIELYQREHYL